MSSEELAPSRILTAVATGTVLTAVAVAVVVVVLSSEVAPRRVLQGGMTGIVGALAVLVAVLSLDRRIHTAVVTGTVTAVTASVIVAVLSLEVTPRQILQGAMKGTVGALVVVVAVLSSEELALK